MASEPRRPCAGACGKNRAERFFKSPKARICFDCQKKTRRASSRNRRVLLTYGITEAEYDTLFASQSGRCAICWGARLYKLDVDHDHSTGLVRGLLCKLCNRQLLPAARGDAARLLRASGYLQFPPAVAVIGERKVPVDGQDEEE